MPASLTTQVTVLLWRQLWVQRLKRRPIITLVEVLLVLIAFYGVQSDRPIRSSPAGNRGRSPVHNATVFPSSTPSRFLWLAPRLVVYAPDTPYLGRLMRLGFPPFFNQSGAIATADEEDMRRVFLNQSAELEHPLLVRSLLMAVLFENATEDPPVNLRYRISAYRSSSATSDRFAPLRSFEPTREERVQDDAITGIQMAIDHIHIGLVRIYGRQRSVRRDYQVRTRRFPHPSYLEDSNTFRSFFALRAAVGFAVPFCLLVGRLADDAASGIRNLQRLIGLRDIAYWIGCYVSSMVTGLASCVVLLIYILYVPGSSSGVTYLNEGSAGVAATSLVLFWSASVIQATLVSALFRSTTLAVGFAIIYWLTPVVVTWVFCEDIAGRFAVYAFLDRRIKLLTSALPIMGLHWCFRVIGAETDLAGKPLTWSDVNSSVLDKDNVSLLEVWGVLVITALAALLLAWTFNQMIVPALPSSRSWLPWSRTSRRDTPPPAIEPPQAQYMEDDPPELRRAIDIHDASVQYGKTKAVDGATFRAFEGQITVLLGQNGAGKTTLMNVLCGLVSPTGGRVSVCGYDVTTETTAARRCMTFCQQMDVLFKDLTVWEHLFFSGKIRGLSGDLLRRRVSQSLETSGLVAKQTSLPGDLSGGMRRRLGVALATVALPRLLILDEPSAGLDPEARRELWDLLLQLRKQCSILLTTHDMEEADVLGDRVIILCGGRVIACGSPRFLKRLFGTGYHVRIAKNPVRCDLKLLLETVKGAVPAARLHADTRHETVFSLGQATSSSLVDLFRELEVNRENLGILSMGVTLTTMEDVYLRLHRDADVGPGSREQLDVTQDPDVRTVCATRRRGAPSALSQARALLWKRHLYSKRLWALPVFCGLVPALLLAFQFRLERHVVELLVPVASANSASATLPVTIFGLYGAVTNFISYDKESIELARDFYLPLLESDSTSPISVWDDPAQSLLEVAEKDRARYVQRFLVGARFFSQCTDNTSDDVVEAWYNPEAAHARIISVNLVHTALLRYYSGQRAARISISLRAEQWGPLGPDTGIDAEDVMGLLVPRFIRALFLPMATCFALAGFVLFPLAERAAGFKHLQLMAGVPGHLYWGVSLFWDLGLYCATGLCCAAPLLLQASTVEGTLTAVAALFGAFSVVGISLAYLGSFLSRSPAVGFVIVALLFFFGGAASTLAYVLYGYMDAFGGAGRYKRSRSLDMAMSGLPVFTFTWGLTKALQLNDENRLCMRLETDILFQFCAGLNGSALAPLLKGINHCCLGLSQDGTRRPLKPLAMHADGVGWEVCLLIAQGFLALTVLLVLDSGFAQATWSVFVRTYCPHPETPRGSVDPDVDDERRLVQAITSAQHLDGLQGRVLVVQGLCKAYGTMCAVKGLDLALRPRECFALLGVNGAGKSTTFGMLTGSLFVTHGTAYTRHAVLTEDLKKWQENIGYCPQQKGLLGRLTGREALALFARLRGVPNREVPRLIGSLLRVLDLEQQADKRSSSYSGGNRRKLSMGIALVGLPDVVFLDEPSAGVDVVARSKILRSLDALRHSAGIALLLSSHSMQECERTCDRVGILVNGELACLGSIQHLKERFGRGYSITVKLPAERTADARELHTTMQRTFPGIYLRDCYQGVLEYQLETRLPWSSLFERASEVQAVHQCEDFLISDTTLEQVFIRLAKCRRPPLHMDAPRDTAGGSEWPS